MATTHLLPVIVTFGLNYEDVNKSYLNVTKISIKVPVILFNVHRSKILSLSAVILGSSVLLNCYSLGHGDMLSS